MLTAATTPTTTPAATPATFDDPPLLEPLVGSDVDDTSAGLVMMTVLPGPVLVTTVGVCFDVLDEVLVVVELLFEELSLPPPPIDPTLVSWPVSQIM